MQLVFQQSKSYIYLQVPQFQFIDRVFEQKAPVAWKVVLYCSNHASICSHALILLSQTRWFVMTGWRTSISRQPVFKHTFGLWFLLYTSISFPLCVSNMSRIGDPCLRTRIQYPAPCSNTFWITVWCLCANISLTAFLTKHVLECGSLLFTSIGSTLCLKHVWNVDPCLRTRISFPSLCFKHVWIMVPCLGTSICLLLPWSKHVWILVPCCVQASVSTRLKHVLIMVPGLAYASVFSPVF